MLLFCSFPDTVSERTQSRWVQVVDTPHPVLLLSKCCATQRINTQEAVITMGTKTNTYYLMVILHLDAGVSGNEATGRFLWIFRVIKKTWAGALQHWRISCNRTNTGTAYECKEEKDSLWYEKEEIMKYPKTCMWVERENTRDKSESFFFFFGELACRTAGRWLMKFQSDSRWMIVHMFSTSGPVCLVQRLWW